MLDQTGNYQLWALFILSVVELFDCFSLCFTIPAIITAHGQECIQFLVLNPLQSQVQSCLIWAGRLCQDGEKKHLFLFLSWVPATARVWTLGLCVCWSASRRCRAADHMRDLKQTNRLVITANHDGGRIVEDACRWLSVCWEEAQIVSLLGGHFSTAEPQQACQDSLSMFWQYFVFIAEEMRSPGKQNTETCCLWVTLLNVNAWGAAVWPSNENAFLLSLVLFLSY